jgi:hypothetical protein
MRSLSSQTGKRENSRTTGASVRPTQRWRTNPIRKRGMAWHGMAPLRRSGLLAVESVFKLTGN